MPRNALILVIDDSPTVRKSVECHLAQAGYRVASAADAEAGLALAASSAPDLILLDHQLPGTTGEEVCRRLLGSEVTAHVPVIISSAMRNKAYARYADFPNVIDQVPKPYTPEVLKSATASALATGARIVQAQHTGCAMPGAEDEAGAPALAGRTDLFPVRSVLDFLNNAHAEGRLTVEVGQDRTCLALASGRVQAAFSPTASPELLVGNIPDELAGFAPLLAVTLGDRRDESASGLIALLEQGLSEPGALRGLLRFQSSALAYRSLTYGPGTFSFEPGAPLPPMFQAFPLGLSLAALAVEGASRSVPAPELEALGAVTFSRHNPRGGNVDRAGLSPSAIRLHALLDGAEPLSALAARVGLAAADAGAVALGLELAGHAERRSAPATPAVLLLDDDAETARLARRVLASEGHGYDLRHVRDRVAAQLLLKRQPFAMVVLPVDTPEEEAFYRSARGLVPPSTRFVGVVSLDGDGRLDRADRLGLDGAVRRPVAEAELRATVGALARGHDRPR